MCNHLCIPWLIHEPYACQCCCIWNGVYQYDDHVGRNSCLAAYRIRCCPGIDLLRPMVGSSQQHKGICFPSNTVPCHCKRLHCYLHNRMELSLVLPPALGISHSPRDLRHHPQYKCNQRILHCCCTDLSSMVKQYCTR